MQVAFTILTCSHQSIPSLPIMTASLAVPKRSCNLQAIFLEQYHLQVSRDEALILLTSTNSVALKVSHADQEELEKLSSALPRRLRWIPELATYGNDRRAMSQYENTTPKDIKGLTLRPRPFRLLENGQPTMRPSIYAGLLRRLWGSPDPNMGFQRLSAASSSERPGFPSAHRGSHHSVQASQSLLEHCQRRKRTVPSRRLATLYVHLSLIGWVW